MSAILSPVLFSSTSTRPIFALGFVMAERTASEPIPLRMVSPPEPLTITWLSSPLLSSFTARFPMLSRAALMAAIKPSSASLGRAAAITRPSVLTIADASF